MDALPAVIKTQIVFDGCFSVVPYTVSGRLLFVEKVIDHNPVAVRGATKIGIVDQVSILVRRVVTNDDAKLATIVSTILRLVNRDAAMLTGVKKSVAVYDIPLAENPV